jgi:hypothetical protein
MATRRDSHGAHGCLLVKAYNILTCLVINKDQIGMHVVPMGGDRTCKTKTKKTHPSTWI